MAYDDTDLVGIALPQSVCWERLKYDVLPRVDIPCRLEVAGRRLRVPVVRARLRTLSSDDAGFYHVVQMYLHRMISLGAFGPKFRIYCQADGTGHTLLQLRADSDRAFESKVITRILAWGYGVQWRLLQRLDKDNVDQTRDMLDKVQVYFDDVLAYTFGQLSEAGLMDGFHRRGYAYIAELLRKELLGSA